MAAPSRLRWLSPPTLQPGLNGGTELGFSALGGEWWWLKGRWYFPRKPTPGAPPSSSATLWSTQLAWLPRPLLGKTVATSVFGFSPNDTLMTLPRLSSPSSRFRRSADRRSLCPWRATPYCAALLRRSSLLASARRAGHPALRWEGEGRASGGPSQAAGF